jgi:hypothetical protein
LYASPLEASGNPSSVVTTDDGAPGMFISIADRAPENTPTTYTPMMVARAEDVSHE